MYSLVKDRFAAVGAYSNADAKMEAITGTILRNKISLLSNHDKALLCNTAMDLGYDYVPASDAIVLEPDVCECEEDWRPYIVLKDMGHCWKVKLYAQLPEEYEREVESVYDYAELWSDESDEYMNAKAEAYVLGFC